VAEHVEAGCPEPVLRVFERPSVPTHALFPQVRLLLPKVRAFADFLVEHWGGPDIRCPLAVAEERLATAER
jgi:hypothetical protein